MHAPLCGIFGSYSVSAAHYISLIGAKSPTNCDEHLAESNSKHALALILFYRMYTRVYIGRNSVYEQGKTGNDIRIGSNTEDSVKNNARRKERKVLR